MKKTWRGRKNPHDRGAFRNWLDFFCRPTPSVVLELDQVESRCEAAYLANSLASVISPLKASKITRRDALTVLRACTALQ